jgi:hypothetical protein
MATAEATKDASSWRFVTPLLIGSALNPINTSLIPSALDPIAACVRRLGRTDILVSRLYLASASAQPTAGKLSEEFGPRRLFLTDISTFGYIRVDRLIGHHLDRFPLQRQRLPPPHHRLDHGRRRCARRLDRSY